MGKTSRNLLRHGAGLVVGLEMIAIGNRLQENRKQMKEEQEEIKQQNAQNAQNTTYEYTFRESIVVDVIEVASGLTEAIMRSGIQVDPAIMDKSKNLIEKMTFILNLEGKEE
jgi:hypothetical protein